MEVKLIQLILRARDARDLRVASECLGMDEKQVRSILRQLGMFLSKQSEGELASTFPSTEWMSAWETKSSDGVNVVLALLLSENEKDAQLLRNKMNEFAAGAKIEFRELFEMEKD
jgi:hypothetical protein